MTDSCSAAFGESLRPGDRLRPFVFERRPRGPHALRVRWPEHRPQREPRVALVHVGRDIDAVDHNVVDQRVDVDVDEPGMADLRVGEVDVAEAGAAEIGAPEHGSGKIPLELFRHAASHRVAASQRTSLESAGTAPSYTAGIVVYRWYIEMPGARSSTRPWKSSRVAESRPRPLARSICGPASRRPPCTTISVTSRGCWTPWSPTRSSVTWPASGRCAPRVIRPRTSAAAGTRTSSSRAPIPRCYRLMWPAGRTALPPAAAESARDLRDGFARLESQGALAPGITPRHAARVLGAALSGVTAAITRDPEDPGNDSLSAVVRDGP